jgi:hypothetical protein
VSSGVYSDSRFFADLKQISLGTVTFQVSDPEVTVKGNQLVGETVTIQARRKGDCESIKTLLTNWPTLIDDTQLISVITSTALESMKNGTRSLTLDELLNDRNVLAKNISDSLELDASKYSVDIINVTINNIALNPEYAAQLQAKALITAQTDTELQRQNLIKQQKANEQLEQDQRVLVLQKQFLAEEAQTAVDVEIASREGKKTAAAYQVYLDNPAAYELERLARLAKVLGDKATVYFVPEGTDLSLLFGLGGSTVVPLTPQ